MTDKPDFPKFSQEDIENIIEALTLKFSPEVIAEIDRIKILHDIEWQKIKDMVIS